MLRDDRKDELALPILLMSDVPHVFPTPSASSCNLHSFSLSQSHTSDASFFLRLTLPGSPIDLGLCGSLEKQGASASWSLALTSLAVSQDALAVSQPAGLHCRLHGGHLFTGPSHSSSFRTSLGCQVPGSSRDLKGSVDPSWRKQRPPSDPVRQVSDTKGAMKATEIWGGGELGMWMGQPLLIRRRVQIPTGKQ